MKLKFQIVGADRHTGEDVEIVVDALDELDAERIAKRRNLLVSRVSLLRSPRPDPLPSPSVESGRPTLAQIQRQIKALDEVDTFGTKKEIKDLPNILTEGETILGLTSGLMDGNTWLIVCTEKRVVFLDKGMTYGLKQRETPLERINSIEQTTGMIFGSIGIWDGASHMEITYVAKRTVRPFVEAVNRAREALKLVKGSNRQSTNNSGADLATQLEHLADLRDRGILTDEELQTQKSKILGA